MFFNKSVQKGKKELGLLCSRQSNRPRVGQGCKFGWELKLREEKLTLAKKSSATIVLAENLFAKVNKF